MSTDRAEASGFTEGATVVRRDVLDGKVWSAAPFRVITDSGGTLVMACWPGAENLAASTFTRWVRTGEDSIRKQAIPNLAARQWELERFTWRDTTLSIRSTQGDYFSVCRYSRTEGASLGHDGWYVNFEVPRQQTAIGYDTFDLLLDLIVEPDLSSCAWKDQDEYAHGRRLGLITDTLHSRGWPAGMRVIVRKERPHPGAQSRFTDTGGHRFTASATDAAQGQLADLELRHRRRARCEDRIRCAKDTGLRNLPRKGCAQNQIWWKIAALACELLAWMQMLALTGTARRRGAQTPAPANPRRRRPPRAQRQAPAAPPRPALALGRGDHPRRYPPAKPPARLTSPNTTATRKENTRAHRTPPTRRDSQAARQPGTAGP